MRVSEGAVPFVVHEVFKFLLNTFNYKLTQ